MAKSPDGMGIYFLTKSTYGRSTRHYRSDRIWHELHVAMGGVTHAAQGPRQRSRSAAFAKYDERSQGNCTLRQCYECRDALAVE